MIDQGDQDHYKHEHLVIRSIFIHYKIPLPCLYHCIWYVLLRRSGGLCILLTLDMADDRDGMEASGTRAPRALGHFVFLLINFSDVCSNFISFLRGGKGSGTRVFGQ